MPEPEEEKKPEGEGQGVTVDLDKKPDEKKPETEVISAVELKKLQNTIAFQSRKQEELMKKLNEMADSFQASRTKEPEAVVEEDLDETDRLAQKDWKAAVRKLGAEEATRILAEERKKQEETSKVESQKKWAEDQLEKSSQRVLERYPQLADKSSDEASLYAKVFEEDPSLLSNVYAPEIAMYRMEDRLREMGRTPASVKPLVDREVERRSRAGAGSVIGTKPSTDGKVHLTPEQKRVCDANNIPYEEYAKNAKSLETKGVVEI